MKLTIALSILSTCLGATLLAAPPAPAPARPPLPPELQKQFLANLDAPLLFVKRHSYTGIHIYDTYYKWPPGGGGIYVLENPSAPKSDWKIRPVIDPSTPETLGLGVYTHPELSWDAKKLLFCFKGDPKGNTSIYEIGIDGKGLRRITNPEPTCDKNKGSHPGQHDIAPAYLPDGRIVFLSTRPSGLVPCFNSGVAILHVMNADGSDIHPISVNNVNEFDPAVMPDGRILFGRWEYVDKNALTIQSLWSINPDGTNETAVFANNMVLPEAVLDARPVPNSHLILGTLAKHNGVPRGSIAFIDPHMGKNNPGAITNLEHPDDPTFDKGNSCEPWPLSSDLVVFSGRPAGAQRNAIEMVDRAGHRMVLMSDPDICLHSPMLIKPRPVPPVLPDQTDRTARTGRFFVQDIYRGLTGVKPGEVKFLRVVEETSRISPTPGGKQPYNQTFLVSAALAFSCKNYLGIVPVEADGSAYFEVPAGRAVYLQALDADGRLIQSMRTFVQAAPGVTRSCIGCHEHKYSSPANEGLRQVLAREPQKLKPESWGSGYMDYPSMIQPILDKNCVSCHGGKKDIAAGIDLSGGWTEHFNISYENLANRSETQLIAHWISGIDCMNGTAYWSAQIFDPRKHGTGNAPLADLIMKGHSGYIPNLSRTERDLLFAWIDSNGLYHGTWDYTKNGCAIKNWDETRTALTARMQQAGCMKCHTPARFEDDWINLKEPAMSRILRAPLAKDKGGDGLEICRDHKASPDRRVRLLIKGYAHAIQPVEFYAGSPRKPYVLEGNPATTFASADDPNYRAMLDIINKARAKALASPRQDMPGAETEPGLCRMFYPTPLPDPLPALTASADADCVVELNWERSARTIGLEFEIHRSNADGFSPVPDTLLATTQLYRYSDRAAAPGKQVYAIVFLSDNQRSKPVYATVDVPKPAKPEPPKNLRAQSASYSVRLSWDAPEGRPVKFNIYRAAPNASDMIKLNPEPVAELCYADATAEPGAKYTYAVHSVSAKNIESSPSSNAQGTALIVTEAIFILPFEKDLSATLSGGEKIQGKPAGKAKIAAGALDLSAPGHVTFAHLPEFDLSQPITVEFRFKLDQPSKMPVLVSCGAWKHAGWFVQRIGAGFRWHVGGVDCDGGKFGKDLIGKWIHLAAVYDGKTTRLYQDGAKVGEATAAVSTTTWPGDLHIGQYSGQPGPDYQFTGQIAGLKIYHRALTDPEISASAKAAR